MRKLSKEEVEMKDYLLKMLKECLEVQGKEKKYMGKHQGVTIGQINIIERILDERFNLIINTSKS